ncbi:hypothetical protein [Roseibium album]|uniref:hypothetical protein n=1 Tax=Roseibium album TaxID=311410 RepID=UPI000D55F9A6|nr:hypothetical protein [Roseibium album]
MPPAAKKTAIQWPKLSGPHICMGAGQQALDLARKGLLSAAEMRGGSLSQAEIATVFEFIAASQNLFDIYRSNYEACGQIHKKQPFVGANKDFFAMSVLRFLCFDIVRKVFDRQIARTDDNWEIEFLHAFSLYICQTSNAGFVEDLSSAYRLLAKEHGNSITAVTIANDRTIREIVARAADDFPSDHTDFVNFSNAVNKALSDRYNNYGPSPIKVSEPLVEKFFSQLWSDSKRNYFRQIALG